MELSSLQGLFQHLHGVQVHAKPSFCNGSITPSDTHLSQRGHIAHKSGLLGLEHVPESSLCFCHPIIACEAPLLSQSALSALPYVSGHQSCACFLHPIIVCEAQLLSQSA